MTSALVAHQQQMSRVFSNEYVFNIPAYQRPYAWGPEQARELFEDLIESIGPSSAIDRLPPYFLGSVVLIKEETKPNADVVDGQQRLTTLTLLLSVLRAGLPSKDASDITRLLYEEGSQILGTQDRFRLTLRERDREFFQRYVQKEGGLATLLQINAVASDSQRCLRDNARYLNEVVQSIGEDVRLRLAQFIATRCYLVIVSTPDLDSAYRIFSVLNTRGLDLSPTDIFKAQILGAIPDAKRVDYTKKWEDAEEKLGREAFVDLFSQIRMVYRKAKPHGTLLAEFKTHVAASTGPFQLVDDVIIPMAKLYEQLTKETYTSTDGAELVNAPLHWLNRLEFKDWLPPALAFAVRYQNDANAMAAFLEDIERLAYSLLITKRGINERIERFSRITQEIEDGSDLKLSSSALQLTAQEQLATHNALDGPIYESLAARARSMILLRLDALVSGGGATYDYPVVSVEHVLPQNPEADSDWVSWFPSKDYRAANVHRLGNLTLLTRSKNSSASNYDFETKKVAYFSKKGVSPFALTTQVLGHEKWTADVIEKRQAELLQVLEKHWRLEGRKDTTPQSIIVGSDGSWLGDVRKAMGQLGGPAPLARIYLEVRQIREATQRSLPPNFEAIIRRTLEENSSSSDSFKNKGNYFSMPDGKGAGVWAIRPGEN